ncbi:hypothetical protein BGZ95_001710 [Linnemannia exigua]|uniref:Ferritin-like domain-containing protein n=1 Tax=Linnemannia exigua TaxID=604196 RepID=A0AAD4DKG4_9FUNG|nr:hypothetical protein BGZ95_001710 [Linnemannia exigua]
MRFSLVSIASTLAATASVLSVMAAPVKLAKRDTASDIGVLNYALTLEHLETEFYVEGLRKFSDANFKDANLDEEIRRRIVHIGEHEATHVKVLTSTIETLGGTPVRPCTYKFPLDDVYTFVAIARALEQTGVSAYLGVADKLDGDLLTAAASIATVEARHSSFLNDVVGETGAPYPFDTPLTEREIFTVASNFITECPYDIGLTPFKQLSAVIEGERVKTSYDGEDPDRQTWCQFLYNNKVVVSRREECKIPPTVVGYFYLVITDTATPITFDDDSRIIAGPALLFRGDH